MNIDIYDVGHGACVVVTAPNGNLLMIDCGHDEDWRPSVQFAGRTIESLEISNYDEDHASDFVNLMRTAKVRRIMTNTSVSGYDLGRLKTQDGMGGGIEGLKNWKLSATASASAGPADFGGMSRTVYWNNYPTDFEDENNLSIVTVVEWAGFKMVFGGDMEEAGWLKLLEDRALRDDLRGTIVYMASHHGRASGCCEEVLDICQPKLVVMSDRDRIYQSQDTSGWYGARASGINNGRRVYTTRNDGHMRISVWQDSDGSTKWSITPHSKLRAA